MKKKKLTEAQTKKLKEHANHHSKKHMKMMKDMMMEGKSFTESHKVAKKLAGK